MDWFEEFIADNKVPIGRWGKAGVDWITANFDWFFDGITEGLRVPIEGTVDLLLAVPPIVFIVPAAALAWFLQRSWMLALFTVAGARLHPQSRPVGSR